MTMTTPTISRRVTRVLIAAAIAVAPLSAGAQALDRSVQPTPGAATTLHVPSWTSTTLANGAQLVVVQKRDLPLVSFSISFIGGSNNYEPADKTGLAIFVSQMLSEGTTSKTGDQLSDAQQLLGTGIFAGINTETGSMQFTSLRSKFSPALDLFADMMLYPSFPAEGLERLRGRALVSLAQSKDSPNGIAANVFSRTLYGDAHPYGRVTTEASLKSITRDDVVAFHKMYFQPGRAVITVVGDVDPASVRSEVARAFAKWPAGGTRPTFDYPAVPASRPTTIYLVDKPKAAQSVFAIGQPGPPRLTADYAAIAVMNNLLGGIFQSRLNHNIREVKGYSYGVSSNYAFGRGPGAFRAGGGVITSKTDSALIEFMKELRGVRGDVPFTDDEIQQGKESLIQSLPTRFSSVNATANSVSSLYTQGLPESYFKDYAARINAVTRQDLVNAAKKYIDLDHLAIVIVGDRATIEAPLRATGIAPIVVLDADGKPIGTGG